MLLAMLPHTGRSQDVEKNNGGKLELGLRSTLSSFSSDGQIGWGTGGQFRLRLWDRVNTEWFVDYLQSNVDTYASRDDFHIGWSVMFYPFNYEKIEKKFTPYLLAGHCFDYTVVQINTSKPVNENRWSSAVQSGLGVHYNLSDHFDISLSTQYMIHLGNDIHVHHTGFTYENGYQEYLYEIEKHEGPSLEGHLLTTLSFNIIVGDLWQ